MSTTGRIDTLPPSAPNPAAARLLEAARTALVVVDIQQKLLPPIFNREAMIRNCRLLLRLASILKLPVLATTQYVKGLGPTVPEIAELLPMAELPDKVEFSCFGCEEFASSLAALKDRDTLVVCGMESHICVTQTALGALSRGYTVHAPQDAIGSRAEVNWRAGLDRMAAAGCVITSTEMTVYELLRKSGTPAFKELLPYIK